MNYYSLFLPNAQVLLSVNYEDIWEELHLIHLFGSLSSFASVHKYLALFAQSTAAWHNNINSGSHQRHIMPIRYKGCNISHPRHYGLNQASSPCRTGARKNKLFEEKNKNLWATVLGKQLKDNPWLCMSGFYHLILIFSKVRWSIIIDFVQIWPFEALYRRHVLLLFSAYSAMFSAINYSPLTFVVQMPPTGAAHCTFLPKMQGNPLRINQAFLDWRQWEVRIPTENTHGVTNILPCRLPRSRLFCPSRWIFLISFVIRCL